MAGMDDMWVMEWHWLIYVINLQRLISTVWSGSQFAGRLTRWLDYFFARVANQNVFLKSNLEQLSNAIFRYNLA